MLDVEKQEQVRRLFAAGVEETISPELVYTLTCVTFSLGGQIFDVLREPELFIKSSAKPSYSGVSFPNDLSCSAFLICSEA